MSNDPPESDEPWEEADFNDDPLLYGIYISEKQHYLFRDHDIGLKAIAWSSEHGYFITFIIHLDNLLFGSDRIDLPTASDLPEVREQFAWKLFLNGWLTSALNLPSWEDDLSQEKRLNILRNFYDRLIIQRVDPAINIPNLTAEEMKLYSRVLNCGRWSNGRQHFDTAYNPDKPHPKTFIESCYLESRVKNPDGKSVPSVRMNCYDKETMFRAVLADPKKKYKPSPKKVEAAKGIYRLEVQVHKPYIENLRDRRIIKSRAIADVLTADFSAMILRYYIHQFAGDGDYYRLSTAKRKIQASRKKILSKSMRDKLCTFLQLLHDTYKSNEEMLPLNEALHVVEKQMGVTAETIDGYRKQLLKLNINPITLPDDSTIKSLKNPLDYVLEYLPSGAEQKENNVSENKNESAELYGESRNYGTTKDIEDWELPF